MKRRDAVIGDHGNHKGTGGGKIGHGPIISQTGLQATVVRGPHGSEWSSVHLERKPHVQHHRPPRRALLVIDVQNEYFTGQLPIEYPPVDISLPNITAAMHAARAAGVPVIVVQHDAPQGSPVFAKGSDSWQLHPQVAAIEADHHHP